MEHKSSHMRSFNVSLTSSVLVLAASLSACSSSKSASIGPSTSTKSAVRTSAHAAGSHDATPEHESAKGASQQANDKGLASLSNGDMAHMYGPDQPLDAETRARLVKQLALTASIAATYPTLKDAKAAGSKASGPFEPGMGIHMGLPGAGSVKSANAFITDDEVLHPWSLLYDGINDNAPLAGFMYYAFTETEPLGFAGPNDHWHIHNKICVKPGPNGLEAISEAVDRNKEACTKAGGMYLEKSNWMVHVWTIPGYESNRGVFSDINPSIACPNGTYFRTPAKEALKFALNRCLDAAA
jgi:hypothetical protein